MQLDDHLDWLYFLLDLWTPACPRWFRNSPGSSNVSSWCNPDRSVVAWSAHLSKVQKKLAFKICLKRLARRSGSAAIVKGALSRYSLIFCAILLWGKIMAAVYLSKRAQQVSFLSIACSEIYTTAPERSRVLNHWWCERSLDQDNSRSFRVALQACFGFHEFFTIVDGQTCHFTFLVISQSPTSTGREEWLCKGNWLILRRRSIAKLWTGEKKLRPRPGDSLVGAATLSLLAAIFDRKKST